MCVVYGEYVCVVYIFGMCIYVCGLCVVKWGVCVWHRCVVCVVSLCVMLVYMFVRAVCVVVCMCVWGVGMVCYAPFLSEYERSDVEFTEGKKFLPPVCLLGLLL